MAYSQRAFYFRKYVFKYTLIFFVVLILMQIIHYSPKCTGFDQNDDSGIKREVSSISITKILHLKWLKTDQGAMFSGANSDYLIDWSSKNTVFGSFYLFILVFYSRLASLEKKGFSSLVLEPYYNSIKSNFFITHTSRVIDQFKCNIRLINTSKYAISPRSSSVFTVIDDFAYFQAVSNDRLHQVFDKYLEPDESALASGTLIGAQSTISTQFKYDLISSGLIHVVVASGYNLTVVTGIVQSVLQKVVSKRWALVLSLASIWWYVFLALSNAAILRAGWMASLSVLAMLFGRPKSIWLVLIFSVLLLVVIDPTLLFNISFQLSVFSTIGVLAINAHRDEPKLEKEDPTLFTKVTNVLKENFQTTVGANIFTLPIILFWFGRVSIISVVANTLLLWLIPFIMYASSIFLAASQISDWLAVLTALPIKVLSNVFLFGVHFFAQLPFASVNVPKITFIQLSAAYMFLFIIFGQHKKVSVFMQLKKVKKKEKK